ncbi:hypothetical protein [Anaeromassilibacillus sp. SJQ-5]
MISRGKVCKKVKAAAFIAFEVVGADVGGILVVFFTVVLVEAGRAVVRVAEDELSADAVEDTPLDSPVLCVVVGPGSVSEAEDPVVEVGVGFGSAQEAREAANTTAKRTAVARLINLIHTFLLSISIMQINSTAPVLGCQASPWYIPDRGLPISFFTGILYLLERMNAYEQPTIKRRPVSRLRRRL